MITYGDYNLPDWTLSAGASATNFIRSQFGFGTRQRRAVRGYDVYGVRIVIESSDDLTSFKTFWNDLNDGNDKFYTDQVINGGTSTSKIVRFTNGYTIKDLSVYKFEITIPLELIQLTN
jgi:hypothetical protein